MSPRTVSRYSSNWVMLCKGVSIQVAVVRALLLGGTALNETFSACVVTLFFVFFAQMFMAWGDAVDLIILRADIS